MEQNYTFTPLHVDIARNSTDDFNLFHDKMKWREIHKNPFDSPILLGFQLEMLIEGAIHQHRNEQGETSLIEEEGLHFSNYQLSFANAVQPGQKVTLQIRDSKFSSTNATLSNRLILKADGNLCLTGFKRESRIPLILAETNLPDLNQLTPTTDRRYLGDTGFFVKRKFITTSNTKNFLCSSLQEQSHFINEVEGKTCFPEMFPCALLSCALLEKAKKEDLDFKRDPMVYTSHKITIDRREVQRLNSNDCLHILVRQKPSSSTLKEFECYGIINAERLLYRALISLTPVAA